MKEWYVQVFYFLFYDHMMYLLSYKQKPRYLRIPNFRGRRYRYEEAERERYGGMNVLKHPIFPNASL